MNISANTLFHFTRDYDKLINILKTHIKVRLCNEKCLFGGKDDRWSIPIACFCDIPLSNILDHTEKYGNYAIGIKKSWAIKKKITPVLYVHDYSAVSVPSVSL